MFTLVEYAENKWELLLNGNYFATIIPAIHTVKGKYTLGRGGKIGYFNSLEDIKHVFHIETGE